MREYDIFLPLTYNDGSPIEAEKFQDIQKRLLKRFAGLTLFPQPNKGFWMMGGVAYRDEIVIFRVLATKRKAARRFLTRLKEELLEDLKQEAILIIERDVETL